MDQYSLEAIRKQIVGNNLLFDTPFGERHLLYADYTASGRGYQKIEEKIRNIEKSYANTHTEDDYSGKYLTQLLHQAESKIKELVNAGPNGKIKRSSVFIFPLLLESESSMPSRRMIRQIIRFLKELIKIGPSFLSARMSITPMN